MLDSRVPQPFIRRGTPVPGVRGSALGPGPALRVPGLGRGTHTGRAGERTRRGLSADSRGLPLSEPSTRVPRGRESCASLYPAGRCRDSLVSASDPSSRLSRPGYLHVQPARPGRAPPQVRSHLGRVGSSDGGRGGAGAGPRRRLHPRRGGARPAGPMGRGAHRPGGCRQRRSLPHPRSAPRGFKAPRAAGGGAASAERLEEMRQGAAPPAPCAPRPRWPWPRSACWRCPPPPPLPTSGQCLPRPQPASPASLPPLLRLEQGQLFPSAGPGRDGTSNSDLRPRRAPVPARCQSSRLELRL